MKFLEINVNGLARCQDIVIDILLKNKIHVLLITEVHRISDSFERKLEAKDYKLYNNPTFGNVWNGTAIIVHNSLIDDDVVEHIIIQKGRINKIKLKIFDKIHHIYCVYLTSGYLLEQSKKRLQEINNIKNNMRSIPQNEDNFVIGGDFNFIESPLDTRKRFYQTNESRLFKDLKNLTEIQDAYRFLHPRGQQVTHIQGDSARRIDRFYTSTSFDKKLIFTDFLSTPFSDHCYAPLLTINKQPKIRWGRGVWKINETLLTKQNHEEVERIWDDLRKKKVLYPNVLNWWDDAKIKLKKYFIGKGIKKKKLEIDESKILSNELNNIHLKTHWSTEKKKKRVFQIKTKLNKLLNNKINGQKIRSKLVQIEDELENNTDFYKHETLNATRKQITELEIDEENIQGKEHIMNAVHDFWHDLWGRKKDIDSNQQDAYLDRYLSSDTNIQRSNFFISKDDLFQSLKLQNKNGSPASDGLTPRVYLWAWDIIADDFTEVINNCYLNGSMSKSMRAAIVTLLPKKGNLKELANWRPVSLLNTDYKILARIITKRLMEDVKDQISIEQKCAIKGRQLFDIHLNLSTALKNCKSAKDPNIITCYDYRKAFDMLDHSIIWKSLKNLNVKSETIKWIQVMYSNITSQIQVNGALSKEILIMRGIRQGCPLSMLLFIIALEALARSLKSDVNIKTPYQDMVLQQYADDLSTITSDVESQLLAKKRVEAFCQISGLEINHKKTNILHMNLDQDQLTALKNSNPLSNIKNEIKVLGIYLNNNTVISNKNWETRIGIMDTKAKNHMKRDITIFGKTKIINTLVLPHMNHIARLSLPTKSQVRRINSIIFKFLWYPCKIEQCSRSKLTRLRKYGGIGIPDIKLRSDAIFASRLAKLVGATLDQLQEPWHADALYQIGSRMQRITPSLYTNRRLNAPSPDLQYKSLLKIYASIKVEGFTWKDAKISTIYFHMQNNLQAAFDWAEILLQEDGVKTYFTNFEREITWRTVNDAYKWRKFIHRHDTLYSFIPGYNTITSQQCIICNSGEDTIRHLLTECQIIKQIWIKANNVINSITTHNFILNNQIITKNATPENENQEDWLIPLKMVNIIKANLIIWHHNLDTARKQMRNKDSWIDNIIKQAEEDLLIFIKNLRKLKGRDGTIKYHIKDSI